MLGIIFIVIILTGSILLIFLVFSRSDKEGYGNEVAIVLKELREKGVKPVPRKNFELKDKAIWAWGSTVRNIGINKTINILLEANIKHIFLLVKGVSGSVVKEIILEILPIAHRNGIYVHAWIVCFNDKSHSYSRPDSHEYRLYLLRIIADFLLLNSSNNFVDGIHLDYIRYPGNGDWKSVSSFVNETRILIDSIAPGTFLSIASKAESYSSKIDLAESALYYGQNYTDLARYVDLFCPMTYHRDYGVDPSSVGIAAKWVKELTHRKVFAGIQLHPDSSNIFPSKDEVREALNSCLNKDINGIIFFSLEHLVNKINEYLSIIKSFKMDG